MASLVLAEPPVITLFVSNIRRPKELFKLLISRPRTAAAIVGFGTRGVAPAVRAFKQGELQAGVRIVGNAVFGTGAYERFSELRKTQVQDNLANIRAELLGSGFAPLQADQLHGVQIPTLLITG